MKPKLNDGGFNDKNHNHFLPGEPVCAGTKSKGGWGIGIIHSADHDRMDLFATYLFLAPVLLISSSRVLKLLQ